MAGFAKVGDFNSPSSVLHVAETVVRPMSRSLIAWVGLGLLILGAGCRMCAHSYDYCGPLFSGKCGEQCDPRYRAGSILSGTVLPVPDAATEMDMQPGQQPDVWQPTDAWQETDPDFGIPQDQIISITDRKLEEPPTEAPPSADQPTVAQSPPAAPQGWTARRPGSSLY